MAEIKLLLLAGLCVNHNNVPVSTLQFVSTGRKIAQAEKVLKHCF
jgi:hypothetical protein